ncbi:hypothetical protein BJV74DRAFT_904642 [Russula compacta]|nr:hypothetical protein BJV74DRAFT_904642 [Russula compacta]
MTLFDSHSSTLLYRVISIICQTLVYGIYLCLVPISVYVMVSKGLQDLSRKLLFAMKMIMFVLSTMYWILSIVITFLEIKAWFSELDPATHDPPDWLPMFSAILLINYILTDGVVVWRAWVLCSDQSRALLMVPIVFLAINTIVYVITIAVRAGLLATPEGAKIHQDLARAIDVAQVSNLGLSLLTNVLATSIIATKAWKYRKLLMECGNDGKNPTRVSKVLSLLVESGMLYILIGVSVLASLVIHLPFGTLGDIFMPVAVQLAGMYPIIVLLLVDQGRSLNSTSYDSSGPITNAGGGQSSRMGSMTFAPGPAVVLGSQNALGKTKPPSTGIHVSFSSTLDPGNFETNAAGSIDSGLA